MMGPGNNETKTGASSEEMAGIDRPTPMVWEASVAGEMLALGLGSETAADRTVGHAYSHEASMMRRLGLATRGYARDQWTDIGTVIINKTDEDQVGDTTVRVEVEFSGSLGWRFTIMRPDEGSECEPGGPLPMEELVITTGTGDFRRYWDLVLLVAENMFSIARSADVPEMNGDHDGAPVTAEQGIRAFVDVVKKMRPHASVTTMGPEAIDKLAKIALKGGE